MTLKENLKICESIKYFQNQFNNGISEICKLEVEKATLKVNIGDENYACNLKKCEDKIKSIQCNNNLFLNKIKLLKDNLISDEPIKVNNKKIGKKKIPDEITTKKPDTYLYKKGKYGYYLRENRDLEF